MKARSEAFWVDRDSMSSSGSRLHNSTPVKADKTEHLKGMTVITYKSYLKKRTLKEFLVFYLQILCRSYPKKPVYFPFKNLKSLPWLVWLSGLSARLQSKGSPVQFPVMAGAWAAG